MKTPDGQAPEANAKLADDEYVIVVSDSVTGELRQCGNLSGYCIRMNPWNGGQPSSEPVAMTAHAAQQDQRPANTDVHRQP